MCTCKISSKIHYQSNPRLQTLPKQNICATLPTSLPIPGWKSQQKRNVCFKSCATRASSITDFYISLSEMLINLILILPRRENGTDYLFKLTPGLLLFSRNTGNCLCISYGRHVSQLQAETRTSLYA